MKQMSTTLLWGATLFVALPLFLTISFFAGLFLRPEETLAATYLVGPVLVQPLFLPLYGAAFCSCIVGGMVLRRRAVAQERVSAFTHHKAPRSS